MEERKKITNEQMYGEAASEKGAISSSDGSGGVVILLSRDSSVTRSKVGDGNDGK